MKNIDDKQLHMVHELLTRTRYHTNNKLFHHAGATIYTFHEIGS